MQTARSTVRALVLLSMLVIMLTRGPVVLSKAGPRDEGLPAHPAPGPRVSVRAASGATIEFTTQNGQPIDGSAPETRALPHLILHRNGQLSEAEARTLIVTVSSLAVPPTGITVTLALETMHGDPDRDDRPSQAIRLWRASRQIGNTTGVTRTNVTTTFAHRFVDTIEFGARTIATPTDYLGYEVTVTGAIDGAQLVHRMAEDVALLLENQWVTPLPEVAEDSPGAAPSELVVFYCDMFPFRTNVHQPETWLARDAVSSYVGTELVPRMVTAFRVQGNEWRFPWHEAWTSYRGGEQLSVALADGRTWYHGSAPKRGHSSISITVTRENRGASTTLTDELISTFHHELMHNWQRGILLHSGGGGDVGGSEQAWQFFSEGTAVLASSVGLRHGGPEKTLLAPNYVRYANGFLEQGERTGGLTIARGEMSPYEGGIYWRFLYEQCGGGDARYPAAGMQVIRRALAILYSGQVVDVESSTDLIAAIPQVMDRALTGSSCPFQTYAQSLAAFARAIRKLEWAQGRCIDPGIVGSCGFYDPHNQYRKPTIRTISYAGRTQVYRHQIDASFGIDLVDVEIDPSTAESVLALEFRPAAGSVAEFSVELWQRGITLGTGELGGAVTTVRGGSHERWTIIVPADYATAPGTLSLIITRLDAHESADPVGEYSLVLRPVAGS